MHAAGREQPPFTCPACCLPRTLLAQKAGERSPPAAHPALGRHPSPHSQRQPAQVGVGCRTPPSMAARSLQALARAAVGLGVAASSSLACATALAGLRATAATAAGPAAAVQQAAAAAVGLRQLARVRRAWCAAV